MRIVHGPYNYCGTQELGLLVGDFNSRPAFFQTYNPPYYRELLENCGYTVEYRMTTWECMLNPENVERVKPFLDSGDHVGTSIGATVRPLDIRHFKRDVETIRQLFNDSFVNHEGVQPFEPDVFHALARLLKPLLDRKLSLLVERNGKPVAFAVVVPDFNELQIQFNGKIGIWQLLTIRRRLAAIRGAVILVIGAIPEVHGSGLGRVIATGITRGLVAGRYERVHTSWIHESTVGSKALVRRLGFHRTREYAIFQKPL